MKNEKSCLKFQKGICKKCKKIFWKKSKWNFYCENCKRKARNTRVADINESPNFSPKKNRSCVKKNLDRN